MEKENLNKQNEVSTETNQQSGSAINAPLFQLQANNQINLPPQLKLSMPIMFSAMSYGSISYNAHESLA